ncbi:sensor histidine kinase [Nocardiopsis algeriensis]|uniref:histidine kinase n=1 Tax=Nocardiopsis algeriensis TaxID=1478215 RepID=A0A841IQF6_9ACTN|nr:sensor histidine kinase [Nocardiopsis algeriensis]MBB6120440.1 signal transduction histidine kinase [Nocardiopsis algeriensis]
MKVWRAVLRAVGHLVVALVTGMAAMVALPLTAVAVLLSLLGGARLSSGWFLLLHRWAESYRARAAGFLGAPAPEEAPPPPSGPRELRRAPSARRLLRWAAQEALLGTALGLAGTAAAVMPVDALLFLLWWALPFEESFLGMPVDGWAPALVAFSAEAAAGLALLRWAVVPVARTHARLALRRLAPSRAEVLAARVDELSRTRAGVVDAHGAELRRIERDLHDGTQARLVAIALQLGVAKEALKDDPRAARLLDQAHEGAEEAMAELRQVMRGIYPPVLADRGLSGALDALAARTGIPTRMDTGDLGTLPVPVETAAYFVVTEAVTNAVRHSGAREIGVRLLREDGVLRVSVRDDGRGGVDEERGTGVQGIRRRVAALDGSVRVDSPAGGPTVLEVELPCGS